MPFWKNDHPTFEVSCRVVEEATDIDLLIKFYGSKARGIGSHHDMESSSVLLDSVNERIFMHAGSAGTSTHPTFSSFFPSFLWRQRMISPPGNANLNGVQSLKTSPQSIWRC
jgi:hypothetical protein